MADSAAVDARPSVAGRDRWIAYAGSVTALVVFGVVEKLLGFAEKVALAFHAGSGRVADAYFLATVPILTFLDMVEDVVAPVFLIQLVATRRERGRAAAAALTRGVLLATFLVLVTLALSAWLGAGVLVRLLAPGFDHERATRVITLLHWGLPAGALLGLSGVTAAALNATHRFARPALSAVVYKLCVLIGIALLLPRIGVRGVGIGILVGALMQLLVQIAGIRMPDPHDRSSDVESRANDLPSGSPALGSRAALRMMIPLAVGAVAAHLGVFVDNAVGSMLSVGALAAVGFARRIVDLPILLLPRALGIVAFPRFASLAAAGQRTELFHVFGRLLVLCLAVFLPITLVLVMAPDAFVTMLLARGRFDASSVTATSLVLRWYAVGLCAAAIELLVRQAYYATLDTRTPILVGLGCLGLNVGVTIGFAPYWGIAVIPMMYSVQKTLKVSVLIGILARRHRGAWTRALRSRILRLVPGAVTFGGVFALVRPFGRMLPWSGSIGVAASLAGAGAAALMAYVGILSMTGILSLRALRAALATWRRVSPVLEPAPSEPKSSGV